MRAETIGWGRAGEGRGPTGPPQAPSPWAGRLLGILLLVLALAAIYHGSAGQAVFRELTGYVAGTGEPAVPAAKTVAAAAQATGPAAIAYGTGTTADALAAAAADTQSAQAYVTSGNWTAADQALSRLSQTWLTLSGALAEDGIPVLDINDFTATLADAQSEVASRDASLARTDASHLASEMNVLALDYVSQEAPTFSELKDLSVDLSAAVHSRNWSRAASDSQALTDLVHAIEQGY